MPLLSLWPHLKLSSPLSPSSKLLASPSWPLAFRLRPVVWQMQSHAGAVDEEEWGLACHVRGVHESATVFGRRASHLVCRRGSLSFCHLGTYRHDTYPYPCPFRGLYLCLYPYLYHVLCLCPYLCRRRTSICQIFGYCAWLATVTGVKSGEMALPSYLVLQENTIYPCEPLLCVMKGVVIRVLSLVSLGRCNGVGVVLTMDVGGRVGLV